MHAHKFARIAERQRPQQHRPHNRKKRCCCSHAQCITTTAISENAGVLLNVRKAYFRSRTILESSCGEFCIQSDSRTFCRLPASSVPGDGLRRAAFREPRFRLSRRPGKSRSRLQLGVGTFAVKESQPAHWAPPSSPSRDDGASHLTPAAGFANQLFSALCRETVELALRLFSLGPSRKKPIFGLQAGAVPDKASLVPLQGHLLKCAQ